MMQSTHQVKLATGPALLAILLIAVFWTPGCASSKASYKSLAVTQSITVTALKAFADARVRGAVTDAQYVKVEEAYKRYQAAFEAAVRAARLDLNATTPEEVAVLASALVEVIKPLRGAK